MTAGQLHQRLLSDLQPFLGYYRLPNNQLVTASNVGYQLPGGVTRETREGTGIELLIEPLPDVEPVREFSSLSDQIREWTLRVVSWAGKVNELRAVVNVINERYHVVSSVAIQSSEIPLQYRIVIRL